ncbi:ABC transporter substrate-binding protein [Oricola indica]|uniref:ABC transporter substrate-binding protein n=1 Tax=Oricola indica TaxID=2872591 RepID=UPI001CBE452B|nr:ABC transporter substrate-binding protein [Oricola indica]
MKKTLMAGVAAFVLSAVSAQAQDLKFPIGEGDFNWASYEEFAAANDLAGEQVTFFGPWLAGEATSIENLIAYFNEATGADVRYTGSDSLEQQIMIDAEAGSAPNITAFPQPGLAAGLAGRGFLSPLGEDMANWVTENYAAGQSWVDLGTYADENGDDKFYGFFFNVNVKSLVWYVPENFEDAGYEVPETMEDLKALTEQIVADGETPWCIGLGSGAATGWPATDWVEDLMLRTQTPDIYDQWVTNEIPFTDERVVAAIEEFGWFARNDDFVAGGTDTVASTDFRDSPKGLFDSPPQCYLHRQASFIPAYFPEGTVVGEDADFFYFPSYAEKDLGNPVLGAGTLLAVTSDSPGTRAFLEFLKTPIAHEIMMAQAGFLTPHKGVNLDVYIDETQKGLGGILLGADTFRFDGSDLMPAAVGQGSFWTGMVDYVGGDSAEDVASEIQASWDAAK